MPVMDSEKFCEAFYTWASANMLDLATDDEYKKAYRKEFREHWYFIELAIHKSCLLDRLIYGGEKLRTEMCPVHQGMWSGCVWENLPCGCQFGANVTGWLAAKPSSADSQ